MYPPTHVAFTYLISRKRLPAPITGTEFWLLAFFSLLPDLVDKTIHYHFGLFASGRNLFHNIFVLIISYGLYRISVRWKRFFLIVLLALTAHLIGDLIQSLIRWTYTDYSSIPGWYRYMFFPIFDPRLLPIGTNWFGVVWELILIIAVIPIWVRDGSPGLLPLKNDKRQTP